MLVKSFVILLPYTSILVTQYVLCLGSLNKFVLLFFFNIPYTSHVHTCIVVACMNIYTAAQVKER
jgi:hypothetical protein